MIPAEISNNQAYQTILTRVSVRRFTDETVSDEQLTAILHAAMAAPSGVNKQPWEFIAVDDRELLRQLADVLPYAKMTANAPVAIIVCGNKERFLPVSMTIYGNRIAQRHPRIFFSPLTPLVSEEYGRACILMKKESTR